MIEHLRQKARRLDRANARTRAALTDAITGLDKLLVDQETTDGLEHPKARKLDGILRGLREDLSEARGA